VAKACTGYADEDFVVLRFIDLHLFDQKRPLLVTHYSSSHFHIDGPPLLRIILLAFKAHSLSYLMWEP
jgi:hypothetical protein